MYLSVNTGADSINTSARIPKQAGSAHKPLSFSKKGKRKEKGSVSESSVGIFAWYLLPCQQCSEIRKKKNQKSLCIKIPFLMRSGLN